MTKEISQAQKNLQRDDVPIFRFVFTGGPCGGKTTGLARIFYYLRDRGFEVIKCPEAYTTLASNGMSADFYSTPGMAPVIQRTVMDTQMALEDGLYRVLKARGNPGVLLCDRGTMDGSVYLPADEFAALMKEQDTDVVQLRDNRYDAVFHLITAADGAEEHYTLENNNVRTESAEEARKVDKRTQRAWVGHPHLYCIDNSTDFEGKMNRLVDVLSKIVGLPSNLKRRSARFLLASQPDVLAFPEEIDYHQFEVEKVYLQQADSNPDKYTFIRKRTSIDSKGRRLGKVYQLTTAQYTGGDNRELIEQKRIISEREYIASYSTRDQSRHIVRQRRISFLYNQQSFGVHIYQSPVEGLCILHAQVEASADGEEPEVDLPPFLQVERRLTDSKEDKEKYGAYSLSMMKQIK